MRRMSKVWWALVVGVSLGVTLVGVKPAKAGPLMTISEATFKAWIGWPDPIVVAAPMTQTFEFNPPGEDGDISSVVFKGVGGIAAGNYVYIYQIAHYSNSSENNINGVSFDVFGPIVPLSGGAVAFQVQPGSDYGGDVSLSDATLYPGTPSSIDFTIPTLARGKETWWFGILSPLPPTKTVATVRDTDFKGQPLVYTPSPEPSTFVLLGMSLLGGVWWRRRLKK